MNTEERITNIEMEIRKLHTKLDIILEMLAQTKISCENMDKHIDFINTTYTSLKAPLDYISHSFDNAKRLLK